MPEIPQFDGVRPDPRTPEAIIAERAAVTTQIRRWIDNIHSTGIQPLLKVGNAVLDQRRADRPVPQFVEVDDAMVVTDRVVVPAVQPESAGGGQRASHPAGLTEIRIPGLDDIRVLQGAEIGRRRAGSRFGTESPAGAAAEALPGAPIHMVPMGGIRKAEGGPERSGPPPDQAPWSRPDPEAAPQGPRVAVLDTGITAEQRADGWLVGLATEANEDLLDVFEPHGRLDLGAGHGTFVAGVIQQVAPRADIEIVKVLDSDGLADEVAIAEAILGAARAGAQVVNLSLGTVTADGQPPLVLQSALRAAIAIQPEILFVCAAGNYADTRECWPGAFSGMDEFRGHVVSVAALRLEDSDGGAGRFVGAEWSTRGDWVSCSVPGQGVVSTYVEGEETDQPAPLSRDTFGKTAWATWTGTSFAAPQITGAISLTMQQDGWTGTPMDAFRTVLADGAEVLRAEGFGTSISILPV